MGRMDQQYVGADSLPEEWQISLEEIDEFFFHRNYSNDSYKVCLVVARLERVGISRIGKK